jgi:branched-chain amino acid aminotransferase
VAILYYDGRFGTPDEARVPLDDPGYLLGHGVFATMRGYEGVCFRAAVHLEDFARGAAMLGIDIPLPVARIAALCNEAAARTGAADAYVRATLTHGSRFSILARPLDTPSDDDYARGIDVTVVSARRIPASCIDQTVKTTSQAPQIVARREMDLRGAREGIMLSVDGALACGTMSNLFVVRGSSLSTPSLESGCRNGVTRRAVMEVARAEGLDVREERLEPSVLASADEAFLTSTRIECLPIARVDGTPIGNVGRSAALRRALRELVRRER